MRDSPEKATLPALVLSARAEAAAREQALAAGADAFMVKPVQFPALLSELNRLLEKRNAPPVPAGITPVPETARPPQAAPVPGLPTVPPTVSPEPAARPNGTSITPDQRPQNESG